MISAGVLPSVVMAALTPRGELVLHLVAALALTWAIGFERELRGSAAGDRTFSLIGLGSAVIAYLALDRAPNALAGVVTGIGFIGAGVIIHGARSPAAPGTAGDEPTVDDDDMREVRGVTTAATIYLAAAVGAACGQGELLLAALTTGAALFLLEVRHARALRWLDGRHWRRRHARAETDRSEPDAT